MIELTKANIRAAIILGMMFGGGIWLSNMVASQNPFYHGPSVVEALPFGTRSF